MTKQPSSVNRLPADILAQLQALLRDPRVSQLAATQQINAILADQGEPPLSKSAVNRYAVKMDKIGAKLTQSRAIAEMWIGKLGNEPAGQVGKLLNEVVRNLAFDAAMQLSDEDTPADPKLIKELAIAIEKLEKASSENEKRDAQIRLAARTEAAEELSQGLKNEGISAELEASIRRILIGK